MEKVMLFEIHANNSADFPKKFGREVKDAGGDYSAARGHASCRFVKIPSSCYGLAREIVDLFPTGKNTIIVLRGGACDGKVLYVKHGEFDSEVASATAKPSLQVVKRVASGVSHAVSQLEQATAMIRDESLRLLGLEVLSENSLPQVLAGRLHSLVAGTRDNVRIGEERVKRASEGLRLATEDLKSLRELYPDVQID